VRASGMQVKEASPSRASTPSASPSSGSLNRPAKMVRVVSPAVAVAILDHADLFGPAAEPVHAPVELVRELAKDREPVVER
jgi:hypothetical protein